MHKKLNIEGLSEQDLALWEEFCQNNQLAKKENTRTKRKNPKIKPASQEKEISQQGDLSPSDLADWSDFCKTNDLPLKSLPKGKGTLEIEDNPPGKPIKMMVPAKSRQKPQKNNTPSQNNIDPKILKRLKSGSLDPERILDLHGMLSEEASRAVKSFVVRAHNAGLRLILVIPGKGKDLEGRQGFGPLNQLIKPLLSSPPTSQYILHFQTAHRIHGGSGAYYIYLKRNKSLRK